MKAWLRGDFSGVDPRAEMELIRRTVGEAAEAGTDLAPLFRALARLDAPACAELAIGPRACTHPVAVRGALAAVPALEEVVAPSGLYGRLATLGSDGEVLEVAMRRHPGADWIPGLARRLGRDPGQLLRLHEGQEAFEIACATCARAGLVEALAGAGRRTGSPLPAVALRRAGRREAAWQVGARTLDAAPDAPVVECLSAVHGPAVAEVVEAVGARVGTEVARARVERLRRLLP